MDIFGKKILLLLFFWRKNSLGNILDWSLGVLRELSKLSSRDFFVYTYIYKYTSKFTIKKKKGKEKIPFGAKKGKRKETIHVDTWKSQ